MNRISIITVNANPAVVCRSRQIRHLSKNVSQVVTKPTLVIPESLEIRNKSYLTDNWTNITPKILSLLQKDLLHSKKSAISLLRQRIEAHFHNNYRKGGGSGRSPLFSVHSGLSPVVSLHENFDSLLVPVDHVSRSRSDSYYVNKNVLLRAHTSAHQQSLIASGRDQFLVFGDCYRRDEVDRTHYPAFHQVEGVRLYTEQELFYPSEPDVISGLFENKERTHEKQETHTKDCAQILSIQLKDTLEHFVKSLFKTELETRWVECYFPFTHPSFELEVNFNGKWLEVLGCGVMEQQLLINAGAGHKVGWAFGIGLERLAMLLYDIHDIRVFWSDDSGITSQFDVKHYDTDIQYKPISAFPQCLCDVSFWLPDDQGQYSDNDFYDLVRTIGGDLVEMVQLMDTFTHPQTHRTSKCFRITYRDMSKVLKQEEVNQIHSLVEQAIALRLGGTIR